jgi:hypothetical protein
MRRSRDPDLVFRGYRANGRLVGYAVLQGGLQVVLDEWLFVGPTPRVSV